MQMIHKLVFDAAPFSGSHSVPCTARFLSVAMQSGMISLWYEFDSDDSFYAMRDIVCVMTGREFPSGLAYLGTVLPRQDFVLHVYVSY